MRRDGIELVSRFGTLGTPTPRRARIRSRRGIVLPLIAACSVMLLGMLALAIDLGVLAVAKAQAQNAADAAALGGARTLDGTRPPGIPSDAPITTADNNFANAGPNAQAIAQANTILGQPIEANQVTITIGKYIFDATKSRFFKYGSDAVPLERDQITDVASIAPTYSWSLAHARVTKQVPPFFSRVFGVTSIPVSATAAAVHRPRDVAIVMDFSTSMSNDSMLGMGRWPKYTNLLEGVGQVENRFCNNPDPAVPRFGHYSSPDARMVITHSNIRMADGGPDRLEEFMACNWTVSHPLNRNRKPLLERFYAGPSTAGSPAPLAFRDWGEGNAEGAVAGDRPLMRAIGTTPNSDTQFAQTAQQALGATLIPHPMRFAPAWEANGYDLPAVNYRPYSGTRFQGFTEGPRYYGKTFFIWPPDPRPQFDWRRRFFLQLDRLTNTWVPLTNTALLFDSRGQFRSPHYRGNDGPWNTLTAEERALASNPTDREFYRINYQAILAWIRNDDGQSGRNPFPNELRAGRILYYNAIPTPSPAINEQWRTRNYGTGIDGHNARFWKEFIDHTLGLKDQGNSWRMIGVEGSNPPQFLPSVANFVGYGRHFQWGPVKITSTAQLLAARANPTDPIPPYAYDDNPLRPRTHMWFGPMMMVDYILNQNLGHYYAAATLPFQPDFAAKMGMQGALRYIQRNHPNDLVSLIYFDAGNDGSRFRRPRVALGKDYTRMIGSLWYHPDLILNYNPTATPRANPTGGTGPLLMFGMNSQVPYPMGGTNYTHPLMLVYNQFSENPGLRTFNPNRPLGDAGGNGRRGAQKLVVFVTDGQPNNGSSVPFEASLQSSGANYSYYRVRFRESGGSSDSVTSAGGGAFNNPTLRAQIYDVTQTICNDSEHPTRPGFSTPRKPVLVHCLGLGQVFDFSSPVQANSLRTLQQMEMIGRTQGPGTNFPNPPPDWIPEWKLIIGSDEDIQNRLLNALKEIMRSGFQLSLIE